MDSLTLPDSLAAQLRGYEARLRGAETLTALGAAAAGGAASFLLLFGLDRFFDTPSPARAALALGAALLCAQLAWRWSRNWLWRRRSTAQLAQGLQRHFKGLGDRLQGVVELAQTGKTGPGMSPGLLRAALRQVAEEARQLDFTEAVPAGTAWRWPLRALGLLMVAGIAFLFAPGAALNGLTRWITPWHSVPRYTFANFASLPAGMVVAHGEPFEIAIAADSGGRWKPRTVTARLGPHFKKRAAFHGGRAVVQIPAQTSSGVLTLRLGDARRTVAIRTSYRPQIKRLDAVIQWPSYLGVPSQRIRIEGASIDFLAGSRVTFLADVSRPLRQAGMALTPSARTPSAPAPLWPSAVHDSSFVTPAAPVEEIASGQMEFRWVDVDGLAPARPYPLRVGVIADAPAQVELRGMDQETALLPGETLPMHLVATDDYGVKSAWLFWRVLPPSAPGADRRTAPAEAAGDPPPTLRAGETSRSEGKPGLRQLDVPAIFAPADLGIAENSTVEVSARALDFFPDRVPSESAKRIIHVLSLARHAERVRERMEQALKDLQERIRDEERQLEETRAIAAAVAAREPGQTPEAIKRAENGERANASQIRRLDEEMRGALREAVKNREIPEKTVAEWQALAERLETEAMPPMGAAAEALQRAGAEPETRAAELQRAAEREEQALAALRAAAGRMGAQTRSLYARNFLNRLRDASHLEDQLADRLKAFAQQTAGRRADEIGAAARAVFQEAASSQDGATREVERLVADLQDFVRRIPGGKYETVRQAMLEAKAAAGMAELGGYLRAALALKSIGRARSWSKQFGAWADLLQEASENPAAGSGGADPEMLELIVAMIRAAQTEEKIRGATEFLEGAEAAPDYTSRAASLSAEQRALSQSIGELQAKTRFKEVQPLLQQVRDLMDRAAGALATPKTDAEVAGLESAAIELLAPPDKKGKSSGTPLSQRMAKMLAQLRSASAGGNNSPSSSNPASGPGEGAAGPNRTPPRDVEKLGGAADSGQWPPEYRDQLEAYFRASESEP